MGGIMLQPVALSPIFTKRVNLQILKQENDVLKQIQAFFSALGLPARASPYPDSHPPNTKTAFLVKSHLRK
jgi:hypothetical protein